jgi:hypothetical protein
MPCWCWRLSLSIGALSIAALSIGALSIGALSIGALSIGACRSAPVDRSGPRSCSR